MINIKQISKKILALILIFSFLTPSLLPKKASAFLGVGDTGDVILGAIFGQDTAKWIADKAVQAKELINDSMVIYQNTLAAKQLVQGIKNFDAETFAKNASSDVLNRVGDAVMTNLGITRDQATNIYTQGQQVVTNFGNYLDMISVNEIKKGLSNIQLTVNTTPYTADIYKDIADFTKNTSDTALGKVVNFSLPYIVKDEICNSPELKNIIKNGEPETFARPKKAVGDVDIDKLCNTSLQKPQKEAARAQAVFIGLANAGYGGPRTSEALANPANTPSGVVNLAISNILAQKDKVVDATSKQTEATGMFLGDQKCVDKDGKEVKFNPEDATQFCSQQTSTAQGSGAVLQEKVSAAANAPYDSIKARLDSIHNKLKNGDLTGAADTMNLISSIINVGRKDIYAVTNNPYDNPYSGLATSLGALQKTQDTQNLLWVSTEEASREYAFGSEKYSSDDLQRALDIYENIRIVNTERLNTNSYTYLVLKTSVERAKTAVVNAQQDAMNVGFWKSIFYPRKSKNIRKSATNKTDAAKKLTVALVNQTMETRDLIKEMAKNNYREQQMRKLLMDLRDTKDVDTQNNQEALAQALDGAYTEKDYEYLISDWQYIPEYSELTSDPVAAIEEDASYYVPSRREVEGPYTKHVLGYLRVRAYLMLRDSLKAGSPSTIPAKDTGMFSAYGIKNLEYLDPNLPRPSAKNTAVIDSSSSKTFSELSYCNQLKIGICNNAELQILTDSLKDYNEPIPDPLEGQPDPCISPEISIRNICAQSANTDDLELRNHCKDETSIQAAITSAIKECAAE
ncbi:MAG: hypothetical protein VB008_02280 [Candidatus Elulimicrobiales bacterium]|nr:hypothetical protein [Candidatus Elulimicrobiales bacterium]